MPQLIASRGYGTSTVGTARDGERLISSFGYGTFVVVPARRLSRGAGGGGGGGLHLAIMSKPLDAVCPPDLPAICAILPDHLAPLPSVGTPLTNISDAEDVIALEAIIAMNEPPSERPRTEAAARRRRNRLRRWLRSSRRRRQEVDGHLQALAQASSLRQQHEVMAAFQQQEIAHLQSRIAGLEKQGVWVRRVLVAVVIAGVTYLVWRIYRSYRPLASKRTRLNRGGNRTARQKATAKAKAKILKAIANAAKTTKVPK